MSNKQQMTKLEIIDELIVNGYAKNPKTRGVHPNTTNCIYKNLETGNRCAVGKCITEEYIDKIGQFEGSVTTLENYMLSQHDKTLDDIMIEKYRGHDSEFWSLVQIYHDSDLNFNEDGLTIKGESRLERLKERVVGLK